MQARTKQLIGGLRKFSQYAHAGYHSAGGYRGLAANRHRRARQAHGAMAHREYLKSYK